MSTFRRAPTGFARHLARLPIWLYRLRLGWLLDGRFLLLTHTGRNTGLARRAVLEVIHCDRQTSTYFVAAGWGEKSQWFRNIQHDSRVEVTVGLRRFTGVAQPVSTEEAERVLGEYARRHRIAMRGFARLFGSGDVHALARGIPVVALRPETQAP